MCGYDPGACKVTCLKTGKIYVIKRKRAEMIYLEACPTTRNAPVFRYRIKMPFFIDAKHSILNATVAPESLK